MDSYEDAIADVYRVLKPGGRFYFVEYNANLTVGTRVVVAVMVLMMRMMV